MPDVQSFINDPRENSIDGPICRWSLRTRGLKNKTEFMRKRTRWLTSSKEIAEVLRGDGRWKRDKRFVHMTGKSETVSEYPASLVVAMLKAIKRQMISDGVIRIEEMHFAVIDTIRFEPPPPLSQKKSQSEAPSPLFPFPLSPFTPSFHPILQPQNCHLSTGCWRG